MKTSKFNWTLAVVDIIDLKLHPDNPRIITDKSKQDLLSGIEKFGLIDKPVVNKDFQIIGGHQRIQILASEGETQVECWMPNKKLNQSQVRELMIRLNQNTGTWDEYKMRASWKYQDLIEYGFKPNQLYFMEKKEEIKNLSTTIPRMELRQQEHHDYVVFLFDDYRDFLQVIDKLKIKQVDAGMSPKARKMGLGRVLPGSRLIELLKNEAK